MVPQGLVSVTFSFGCINLFTTLLLVTDDARFLPAMFAVIGLNWFEFKLATTLMQKGAEVIAIEEHILCVAERGESTDDVKGRALPSPTDWIEAGNIVVDSNAKIEALTEMGGD
jgi:hypothetical protein